MSGSSWLNYVLCILPACFLLVSLTVFQVQYMINKAKTAKPKKAKDEKKKNGTTIETG